jgi:hypothetical protein
MKMTIAGFDWKGKWFCFFLKKVKYAMNMYGGVDVLERYGLENSCMAIYHVNDNR